MDRFETEGFDRDDLRLSALLAELPGDAPPTGFFDRMDAALALAPPRTMRERDAGDDATNGRPEATEKPRRAARARLRHLRVLRMQP